MKKYFVLLAMGLLPVAASAQVVLDDFESGVTAVNHPAGAGVYGTWYDVTHNAFATMEAGTLDSSASGDFTDGGFTNGVYIIYDSPVPADGDYRVTAKMHITEDAVAALSQFQIGVKVNGIHRPDGTPSVLDPCDFAGNYVGLTEGDDSGLEPQVVTTDSFTAATGDDILIALSSEAVTDPSGGEAGPWNDFAATLGGNFAVLIDDITLVPDSNVNDWNLY